jgi:hypothetical protein
LPVRTPENYAYNRYDNRAAETPSRAYAGNNVRPAQQNYAYARPQSYARPGETYARPGGYGNSFYGNSTQAYAGRPASPYAGQQFYRAPAPTYQRYDNAQRNYAERSYADQRSYSNSRSYAEPKQDRSGGQHMFGGGHGEEHYKATKAPKAPKMSGGGGGHHGGGLFSHHGR